MALTLGGIGAPSSVTTNLDSVFALSLANYSKTLVDSIGSTNALLYDLIKSENYQAADGGTYIAENLMYAINTAEPYSGNDELSTGSIDGIGQCQFEWRQLATPIQYSMLEVFKNQHRIQDLVKARIQQAELGMKESFSQHMWWGAAAQGGAITSPYVGNVSGANSINPLPLLVSYNTSNLTVGNISETGNSWWRPHSFTSAATTYSAFILELTNAYNTCSLGTGGPPTHIVMDQVTYQLFCHAYFSVYKMAPGAVDQSFPFEAVKFMRAKVIMDDKVPDAYSGTVGNEVGGVVDSTTLTYGTAYFFNMNYIKCRYNAQCEFTMLKDDQGRTFQKPINGDSRVGHMAWMGNFTINNRRKHGVLAKIARNLS